MRLITALVLLSCAVVPSVRAADADAKSLIAESGKALFSKGSFRTEQQMSVEMHGPGMDTKQSMTLKTEASPGKFRMDLSPTGISIISDGESTYFWMAPLNQYMKKPAASSPEALADLFMPGAGSLSNQAQDAMTARIVREEPLMLQGQSVDCYVVEAALDNMTTVVPAPAAINNSRQTMWIDKDRKLVLKQISDVEVHTNATDAPMKIHQELTVTSLDLSPVFSPEEFTFTPPIGSRQVDNLPGIARGQ